MFPETISIDTARLIEKIKNRSWLSPYYLAGGTALALHLGHRTSIGLDFFTEANMEEMTMVDYLRTAGDLQLDRMGTRTIIGNLDGIRVSFLKYPYRLLDSLEDWNGLRVEKTSLALMKPFFKGFTLSTDYSYYSASNPCVSILIHLMSVDLPIRLLNILLNLLPVSHISFAKGRNWSTRCLCYWQNPCLKCMSDYVPTYVILYVSDSYKSCEKSDR